MSVVTVDEQSGEATVMTKGADSIMEPLIKGKIFTAHAKEALHNFSLHGLRTLVLSKKTMSKETYTKWKTDYAAANALFGTQRELEIERVVSELEMDLDFVGITALEDRLQDGVPETIQVLREAGLHVWVLTGDKVETAVEIAKSCNLFEARMEIHQVVNCESINQARNRIKALLRETEVVGTFASAAQGLGIVLDGRSAQFILQDPYLGREFYTLAGRFSSCVACRLSPAQKAELVRLVRNANDRTVTLSIGDGANDVPMIQAAHVGIGIHGKEGSAAVQNSDIAIAQFQFLKPLVMLHGRKAYRRIATFLSFFVYKGVVLGCSYVINAFQTGFIGVTCFATFMDDLYNFLSSGAAAVLLVLDREARTMQEEMEFQPRIYRQGPERAHLNTVRFSRWLVVATCHGVSCWLIPMWINDRLQWGEQKNDPNDPQWWEVSFIAYTLVILVIHMRLLLVTWDSATWIGTAVVALEVIAYFLVVLVLSYMPTVSPELSYEDANGYHSVVVEAFIGQNAARNILTLLIAPCIAALSDFLEYLAFGRRERVETKLLQQRRRIVSMRRTSFAKGSIEPCGRSVANANEAQYLFAARVLPDLKDVEGD